MTLAVGTIGGDLTELSTKLRERMAVDLFFTMHAIFGLTFLDAPFHRDLAAILWAPQPHRTLIFAPRGGGKTTIAQAKAAALWLLNPSAHILLTSYNSATAQKNLAAILRLIRERPMVAQLFPDLAAAVAGRKTRKDQVDWQDLDASGHPDPTFKTAGIDSGITGGHYHYVLTDDLIDEVNARSPSECARAFDWVEMTTNCMEHQLETPWDLIGTRYHLADTYQRILDEKPTMFHPFIRKGYFQGPDGELRSYWPAKFPASHVAEHRQSCGSYNFAAQIQQDPIQHGDALFREEWLRSWSWQSEADKILVLDNGQRYHLSHLSIFLVYDPALDGDYATARNSAVVFAMDPDENVIVLEAWADKCSSDVALKQVARLCAKWQPDVAAVEEVLFQTLIRPILTRYLSNDLLHVYNLTGVKPRNRSKDLRIFGLQPIFEQGRVYVHPSQAQFMDEYIAYPLGRTCDILDALAYGPDIWYPPRRRLPAGRPWETRKRAGADGAEGADPITGY